MSIDCFFWPVGQLCSEADRRHQMAMSKRRHNPRPAGVIQNGSATDAVRIILEMRPGTFFRHGQLVFFTGRSTKAVCFALRYLQRQGVVRAVPDILRNPRYLRYSCTTEGETNRDRTIRVLGNSANLPRTHE